MQFDKIKEGLKESGVLDEKGEIKKEKLKKVRKNNKRVGRPSKLTYARKKKILELISKATPIQTACKIIGIDRSTLDKWYKKALEGHDEFVFFFNDLDRAAAETEAKLAAKVAEDADWRAKAFILERRHPERWGREPAVAIQVNIEQAAVRVAEREGVDPKQLESITGEILDESDDDG